MSKSEKIECHTCDGMGYVTEKKFATKNIIKCVCPECKGRKWVPSERSVGK